MRSPGLPLFLPFDFYTSAIILLLLAIIIIATLALLKNNFYNRLSTRIIVLIFISGLVTLVLVLAFNEITRDTLSPLWLRQLQIVAIVLGGPIILGLLAARFIRRPLRQFHDAITSLEKNDTKVQLQPSGVLEFDEVFSKFNDLINRLQHEEKLRKDLVSDTSHELNTPLTVMIGQLTALQEGKYSMTDERIVILKEQAERLVDLVQQLDAYTKARMPDAGLKEDISFKKFCEELARHFSMELKQKGISVKLRIAEGYSIYANREALQKIFTNLTQNALHYSEGTEIVIEAAEHRVRFSDNGKGVPSESIPHLFERFYRVDRSRSRSSGGIGLGLSIVKELTEQQGWHIKVQQASPGLIFILDLKE